MLIICDTEILSKNALVLSLVVVFKECFQNEPSSTEYNGDPMISCTELMEFQAF